MRDSHKSVHIRSEQMPADCPYSCRRVASLLTVLGPMLLMFVGAGLIADRSRASQQDKRDHLNFF